MGRLVGHAGCCTAAFLQGTFWWAMAVQSLTCMLGWSLGCAGRCTAAGRGLCCCKVANYLQAKQALASRSVGCMGYS